MKFDKFETLARGNQKFKDCHVQADIDSDGIVTLRGEADSWRHVVDLGHMAARMPAVVNVMNLMTARGIHIEKKDNTQRVVRAKNLGTIQRTQVTVIGGGVIGCAVARELSKYQLDITVLEKNADVAEETTKANNGYIHPGHKVKPGTLKAKLNVLGNAMYDQWQQELGFEMERCGQIAVAYTEEEMKAWQKTYEDGLANGVPGIRMLTAAQVKEKEPYLAKEKELAGGLETPSMAVVEPYQVCVALAENACVNGVKFMLSTEVLDIEVSQNQVRSVVTERGVIETEYVINCAGVYADDIAAMAGDQFYTLHARKGGLAIFDKNCQPPFSHAISTLPRDKDEESKGGGFAKTTETNILVGPSAVEVPDKEDKTVEESDLDYAFSRGLSVYPQLQKKDMIAMYAGVRAADYKEDFIIQLSKKIKGFIHVAGIQSPGLASAPAIALMVEELLKEDLAADGKLLVSNANFNPRRKPNVQFRRLSRQQQDELIRKNPAYGQVICRCEQVTEGEILETLRSPLIPTTVDAIKRRTRAGMGRCQGGFCQPRIVEILARELGRDWTEIYLKGRHGYILERKSR